MVKNKKDVHRNEHKQSTYLIATCDSNDHEEQQWKNFNRGARNWNRNKKNVDRLNMG